MGTDGKKTHSKILSYQTNASWLKIRGTNFGGPVHGGERNEFFDFLENSKKHL